MSDEPVAVVGAGSWGTTLAKLAGDNGKRVLLWCRNEELARSIRETRRNATYLDGFELSERVEATSDLERVCKTCAIIVLVVPSHGLRAVAREMGAFLRGDHVVIHATKGLEQGSWLRMSQIIAEETCVKKIGVLAGPNLARELAQGQPAGTLVASRYDEVFARAHAALHGGCFRVYAGRDVIGAEIGGAFKNVVALAAGVAAGLGFGDNTRALLLTRALSEMARLGVAMGADPMTFGGMAGIGDLIATCMSPLSRNHQVGARLAKGESLDAITTSMKMVAEGVKTTRAIHEFAGKHRLELPIVHGVHRLLYQGHSVPQLLTELMAIPTGTELSFSRK